MPLQKKITRIGALMIVSELLIMLFVLRWLQSEFNGEKVLLQKNIDSLKSIAKEKKLSLEKINATVELVDKVVPQILKYAYGDGFVKLSGLKRFTPSTGDEYWQPTPPGFMAAIEPYWSTLRPFILDSCSQFICPPPDKYNADTSSLFYKDLKEVYEVGKNLSKEQAEIAMFWDCNPFALQQVGHLEFGIKKISPGGHWMGITGIACKKQKLNLSNTVYVHTLVAIGIADAFISCWSDKYKYNRVRPITAIKKLIDQNWNPLLQTPPFPEYASGHSVISTTAATILTNVFGDHFSFVDNTEIEFGLPLRKLIRLCKHQKKLQSQGCMVAFISEMQLKTVQCQVNKSENLLLPIVLIKIIKDNFHNRSKNE